MSNPYMRHINRPQAPRPLWLRVISYISAGIVLVLFGVFMMMWKYLKAKDRFGRLRDID
jgi:hypothetical protein